MEPSSPKRKTGLKRTGFKRKPKKKSKHLPPELRPTKAARTVSLIRAEEEFKKFARDQRVCAVCGQVDSWDAHHVIEAQYLKKNGHPVWVKVNALRTCDRFSKNDCHGKHTRCHRKIKLKELMDENIDYAFALMGPKAYDYLTRHYDGKDPRVERALKELTEAEER